MKNRATNQSESGLTLMEVTVMVACLAVLVAALLPALAKAKAKAQRASCQCRLKQIGLAFRTWEGDFGDKYPMSVSNNVGGSMEWLAGPNLYRHYTVMSNELNNSTILNCPSDDRPVAKDFEHFSNSNLSYFVGLDCDETRYSMLLSGDRNLVTNGVPVVAGLVVITPRDAVGWSEKMHKFAGNIGLADGSVQQTANGSVQVFFNSTGTNINRLAVP